MLKQIFVLFSLLFFCFLAMCVVFLLLWDLIWASVCAEFSEVWKSFGILKGLSLVWGKHGDKGLRLSGSGKSVMF